MDGRLRRLGGAGVLTPGGYGGGLLKASLIEPTTIANLKLWLKADAGVTMDTTLGSTTVARWANQAATGSAYDATQGVKASQPQLVSDALNHLPSLHFDGVDDWLDLPAAAGGILRNIPGATVFMIVSGGPPTNSQRYLLQFNTQSYTVARLVIYREYNGAVYKDNMAGRNGDAAAAGYLTKTLATPSAYAVNTYVADFVNRSASITVASNNSTASTSGWTTAASNTDNINATQPRIGSGVNAAYYYGNIVEILIYDRTLSASERALIEAYLLSRSGL